MAGGIVGGLQSEDDEIVRRAKKRKLVVCVVAITTALVACHYQTNMIKELMQDWYAYKRRMLKRLCGVKAEAYMGTDVEWLNDDVNLAETSDDMPLQAIQEENHTRQSQKRKKVGSSSNPQPKKRACASDNISAALLHMASVLEKYMASDKKEEPSAQKVFDEVAKVKDLSNMEFLKACDLLMADQRKFELFSYLPIEMKKEYIFMHVSGSMS